jgi:hypothetical protein
VLLVVETTSLGQVFVSAQKHQYGLRIRYQPRGINKDPTKTFACETKKIAKTRQKMSSDLRAVLLASVAGAVAGAAVVFYLSPQKSSKSSGVRTIILEKGV